MKLLTRELMQELMAVDRGPCLSLYQPTHRILPGNLQDPVRYKNLVKQLEESLKQKYSNTEARLLIEPFEELGNDNAFWKKTLDGLAVLSAPGYFEVIGLPVPVEELTVAANSFHLKPLRQYLQTADRFQILCLSLSDIKLYEGNRHAVAEIELPPDIPKTLNEALGEEITERHSTSTSLSGPGRANLQHGQGTKKDDTDKDAERFFRIIDKHITDHYSRNLGLPLLLAALPEHHNLFRKISHNQMLLSKGIMINPKSVTTEKLRTMAWEILEPEYTSKIEKLGSTFEEARSHGFGSDNPEEVALAASEGRVDTLLSEAGRLIGGKLVDGSIQQGDLNNPEMDDVLDDLGELVMSKGGNVLVIPKEKMPAITGVAAIFRY